MRVFFHARIERASFIGDFISCFQKGKGKSEGPLVPAVFQVPVVQNNPYANVAYFAVAHSATFHYLETSVRHSSEGAVYVSIIQRNGLNCKEKFTIHQLCADDMKVMEPVEIT